MKAKKILASFLALLLILGSIPFTTLTAFAASGGSGTADDPYEISSEVDLRAVANDLNASYILTANIEVSGDWTPLGTAAYPFQGRLDGGGYTISISIGNSSDPTDEYDYTGLFGYIGKYANVYDLGVYARIYVDGGIASGILAGKSEANLVNCHTSGTVSVSGVNINVGGMVGENAGSIANSYSTADVLCPSLNNASNKGVGGIAGISTGEYGITNCYNAGNVTGRDGSKYGMIVGFLNGGILYNCYWNADYYGYYAPNYETTPVPAGYDASGKLSLVTVTPLSEALLKGTGAIPEQYGGYVADVNPLQGVIYNICYNGITLQRSGYNGTMIDLLNKGRGAIQAAQLPSGVKASAWAANAGSANGGYPVFTVPLASDFSSGSGTSTDPYIITNAAQLAKINDCLSLLTFTVKTSDYGGKYIDDGVTLSSGTSLGIGYGYYFKLGSDIDYSGFAGKNIGEYVSGSQDGNNYFYGSLDGDGYKIFNFPSTKSLFHYNISKYSIVQNLGLDCNGAGSASFYPLTQTNYGFISNCHVTGAVTSAAAMFLRTNCGTLINSYSSVNANTSRNGFIDGTVREPVGVGLLFNGLCANNGATGSIESITYITDSLGTYPETVSGFASAAQYGPIMNSYTAVNMPTGMYGFSKYMVSPMVNCYWDSSIATQVYSTVRAGIDDVAYIIAPSLAFNANGTEIEDVFSALLLTTSLDAAVMKGNATSTNISYFNTTNQTNGAATATSFLEALNEGRKAVGANFTMNYKSGETTKTYTYTRQKAPNEELYQWVYIPGVNEDYPIPYKPFVPSILTQTAGKTVNVGETATFSTYATVRADNQAGTYDGALSYQWQKSTNGGNTWKNISGETGMSYSTAALTAADSGSLYRCVITNTAFGATSSVATDVAALTVSPSVYPLNPTVEAGNAITFGVDGAGPYQWQVSTDGGATWDNITDATLSYYSTAALNSGDNGSRYRCIMNGTASAASTVTVTTGTVTVTGVTVTPGTVSVQKGSTYTFAASVTGTHNSQAVVWSVEGQSGAGTWINAGGVLTAAPDETGPLTVRATSVDDPSKSATALVTVTEIPATVTGVTVTPGTASVTKGTAYTFSAAVAGTHNPSQAVNWSVSGNASANTVISPVGELSVAADETATALIVTAVSGIDGSKFGSAAVTVTSPAATVSGVTVTPDSAAVAKGSTYTFGAAVIGTNNPPQAVNWSVSGNDNPATIINSSGVLAVAAGETAAALTVTATSVADGTVSGSSVVTVTEAASTDPTVDAVTVNPPTASVVKGGTAFFAAVVTGSNNPAQTVSWDVYGKTSAETFISSGGLLAIGTDEMATTLTVMAKSSVDSSKSGTAAVTVTSPEVTVTNVDITPNMVSIAKGSTYTFSAAVTGANNPSQAVSWAVSGGNKPGTIISSSGVLAIASGETAATLTVTATSAVDSTKSGTATVTVSETSSDDPTVDAVIVNPATATVARGAAKAFSAVVTGSNSPSQEVAWSVTGKNSINTAISNTGELTVGADETATSLAVTAASTLDSSKSGTATVTVTTSSLPEPTVSAVIVSTTVGDVQPGGTKTFTSVVTGTNNPPQAVTWSVTGKNSANTTISSTGVLTVGADETAASLTVRATSVFDNTKSGLSTVTVTYPDTTTPGTGGGGGGGGGTAAASPVSYNASVSGTDETGNAVPKAALGITVNPDTESASVKMGSAQSDNIMAGGKVVITVPSIPNVTTYTLGLPAESLSNTAGQGSLTLRTDAGSIVLPADMLADRGATGKTAELSIAAGDKTALPEAVKASIGNRPLIRLTLAIDGKQTDWYNPKAPVTVSIPYTPSAAELVNPESIIVWYIDGNGNVEPVPNGRYDAATGTVNFSTTHFSDFAVAYTIVSFTDVPASDWYGKAVGFIAARGITTGTGDGQFNPEGKLTRGQFLVMLMRAYGIAPDATPKDNFADAGNTYYTGYLAAAKRLKISEGVGGNRFAPDKEISRQELFTLLYNSLKLLDRLPEGKASKSLTKYSDANNIASWAKEAMQSLLNAGIITGSYGRLLPESSSNRAQLAQVLYNLLAE